jgi:predicted O-linked N-acetylglucosamine transferase (SPINDLY family)
MTQATSSFDTSTIYQQATTAFELKNYAQAIQFYEQIVAIEPGHRTAPWYLGLAYLLSADEASAQLTWMMALSAEEPEKVEAAIQKLIRILQTEAEQQELAAAEQIAWTIRQHIREIAPNHLLNLLHLVRLSHQLRLFEPKHLVEWQVISLLQANDPSIPLPQDLLLNTLGHSIEYDFEDASVQAFVGASLLHIEASQSIIDWSFQKAQLLWRTNLPWEIAVAVRYAELCVRYAPHYLDALSLLSSCYYAANCLREAIEVAERYCRLCQTLPEKLEGNGLLMSRVLRTGGRWQETKNLFDQQLILLKQLWLEHTPQPGKLLRPSIFTLSFFMSFYFEDAPAQYRPLQNQIAQLYQDDLQFHAQASVKQLRRCQSIRIKPASEKLRVAYISRCLRQHSVGWLARWLFEYHDRDRFDIYTYYIHLSHIDEFGERWFVKNSHKSAKFDGTIVGIAEHICENDNIDILVDLDSLTYDQTCGIMALKPAPVQVSWLGLDASGIPAIDYFIADPYVLPENAQEYYSEKIWRLPQTYVAVNGFEVGVPTLRRDHLDIPSDAIIYFSAQQGHKRHPDTVRLQLRILREVPNSYFLIKGFADNALLRETFETAAAAEGVSCDRLRFLPLAPDELTHRANLNIADVVLDTFPYNGATTTLETLWMGIPIVTKVGQQFAARNSYTFMVNAGISEGIAWSDDEYVEWGIRLGTDADLRQQIRWKLWRSRQTSPLWNARQFTQEMEAAYEEMWRLR